MGSVGRVCRPGSVDTVVGTRTEGRVRSSNQDGGKVRRTKSADYSPKNSKNNSSDLETQFHLNIG